MDTSTYIVQSGDTLSIIAEKTLGASNQWRFLADINNLSNPNNIKVGQKLQIPVSFSDSADNTLSVEYNNRASPNPVQIFMEGKTVFAKTTAANDWYRIGKLYKKGLFRRGNHEPEHFISNSTHQLSALNLSQSDINVILATAENEGNLDAINTWDNQFISFGMFQWTAGGKDKAGELAALLDKIKQHNLDLFHQYWGKFGLDTVDCNTKTGWLSLNGQRLKSAQQKSVLREPIWAYRFAIAGADKQIKAIQIAHATARINQFYFTRSSKLGNYKLAELITSELGVSLLLDNHVNRPGYVFPCVALAIQSCDIQAADLTNGDNDLENKVLASYLKIRISYGRNPMTNAEHRGQITRKYLDNGIISDQLGSFQSSFF